MSDNPTKLKSCHKILDPFTIEVDLSDLHLGSVRVKDQPKPRLQRIHKMAQKDGNQLKAAAATLFFYVDAVLPQPTPKKGAKEVQEAAPAYAADWALPQPQAEGGNLGDWEDWLGKVPNSVAARIEIAVDYLLGGVADLGN